MASKDTDNFDPLDAAAFVQKIHDLIPSSADGHIMLGDQYGDRGEFRFYLYDGEVREGTTHVNAALFAAG